MSNLAFLGGPKIRNKPIPNHPIIGDEEKKQVLDVLNSGNISTFIASPGEHFLGGKKIREFEKKFEEYFGFRSAVWHSGVTKKRKKISGSIINISSQLGKVGASNRSVYSMTKFGIEGLTRGMAIDLAKDNIRVNTVCPTFVETPMVKNFFKNTKFKKLVLGNIPIGKVASESDVATTVCFLASSASSMITGTSIIIDIPV